MSCRRSVLVLVAIASWFLTAACAGRPQADPEPATPRRIVSMAPSLTETLLALGLGDRIVGVTRYCPAVEGATEVGGFVDPNFEAIVALDPDLVVLMQSHDVLERRFSGLGLATLQVDQHDVAGVLDSVAAIAARCGVPERGRHLVADLRRTLDGVAGVVTGLPRPRVLVVVGRDIGSGRIGSLWGAAPDTFFDDVIRLAGGANAITGSGIRYPEISREGLLSLDPDVIFDVVADGGARGVDTATVAADWNELADLRAVRENRILVLTEDFVAIPGPRIVDTVTAVARRLHPDAEWP